MTERARRALSHVGGAVRLRGDPELGAALARALDVATSLDTDEDGAPVGEGETRAHVHGFHAYPARMHPRTAERLVTSLSPEGGVVLDPFCGSGTVVVEARLAGRRALGIDLNPLAVAIAHRKATPASAEERSALVGAARAAAAIADERRKARSGASRRYPREDVAAFDAHVLLELDGLRVGIERTTDARARADLWLVLSAILVKLSRKRSDTAAGERATRIAAGYPARLFVEKTEELARSLEEVEARLAEAPRARLAVGDARRLDPVRDGSVDLVLTSPPYAAVYDYVEHHRMRLRWLGLDARSFERGEIGARRALGEMSAADAEARYREQIADALCEIARVLRPRGLAVLLVADSAARGGAVRADRVTVEAGAEAGLEAAAVASQDRPHFHGPTSRAFCGAPRQEHAVVLRPRSKLRGGPNVTRRRS